MQHRLRSCIHQVRIVDRGTEARALDECLSFFTQPTCRSVDKLRSLTLRDDAVARHPLNDFVTVLREQFPQAEVFSIQRVGNPAQRLLSDACTSPYLAVGLPFGVRSDVRFPSTPGMRALD